ncbi:MAG: hypothetical protein JXB29_06150 [Sedimentisphaerales bacterium]|nr:hypothetical protein [Sedimentisphaerales bacterium]
MDEQKKCLRCGGSNMVAGSFQSTGLVYFKPKGAKVLTVHTSGVSVRALTCIDCGHVELEADPAKVKSLMK